jgi:hypothetical protein
LLVGSVGTFGTLIGSDENEEEGIADGMRIVLDNLKDVSAAHKRNNKKFQKKSDQEVALEKWDAWVDTNWIWSAWWVNLLMAEKFEEHCKKIIDRTDKRPGAMHNNSFFLWSTLNSRWLQMRLHWDRH